MPRGVPSQPRSCAWCGDEFQPTSNRQRRCDTCQNTKASNVGRCETCGSLVSGRAHWGQSWGGECDRAEAIAAGLMERLNV